MKRIFTLLLFVLGLTVLLVLHTSAEAGSATFYNGEQLYTTLEPDASGTVTLPVGPSSAKKFIGWSLTTGNTEVLYPAGSAVTVPADTTFSFRAVAVDLKTLAGAAVSVASPTTLRFDGAVDANDYARLTALVGADNVTLGLLIAPTNSIYGAESNSTKFSHSCNAQGLLDRTADSFFYSTSRYHVFTGRTNAIADSELLTMFSARAYLTVDLGDTSVTVYATYVAKDHDRMAHYVTAMAFEDRAGAADATHSQPCADTPDYYSPYPTATLNALQDRLDCVVSVSQSGDGVVVNEFAKTTYGSFLPYRFYTSPYRVDRSLKDQPKGYDTYVIVGTDGADFNKLAAYFIGHSYRPPNRDEWKSDGLYISVYNIAGMPH